MRCSISDAVPVISPFASCAETESHLLKVLVRADEGRGEALQTLLSVTARPEHPLNADWLDQYLRPLSMAERDAIWSTAIFGGWKEDGGVRR